MNEIGQIAWLFPVIFMIHDFEEIILVKQWKKNEYYGNLKHKPYNDFISTASFSVAVGQEFIIFSIVTFLSVLNNSYLIWFALFASIVLHFLIHGIISIKIKKYHPGLATSILFLPIGVILLYSSAASLNYSLITVIILTVTGMLLIVGNLKLLHRLMPVFEKIIKLV